MTVKSLQQQSASFCHPASLVVEPGPGRTTGLKEKAARRDVLPASRRAAHAAEVGAPSATEIQRPDRITLAGPRRISQGQTETPGCERHGEITMSRFGTKEWQTVRVLSSQALGGPGRAAIGLVTSIGSIAFEVDQKAIDALRRDLVAAEQMLRGPTTKN
jgi:hypothetical protein